MSGGKTVSAERKNGVNDKATDAERTDDGTEIGEVCGKASGPSGEINGNDDLRDAGAENIEVKSRDEKTRRKPKGHADVDFLRNVEIELGIAALVTGLAVIDACGVFTMAECTAEFPGMTVVRIQFQARFLRWRRLLCQRAVVVALIAVFGFGRRTGRSDAVALLTGDAALHVFELMSAA